MGYTHFDQISAINGIAVGPQGAEVPIGMFLHGDKYYVDTNNGNDGYDGLTWARPFKTLMHALHIARHTAGTYDVNYDKDHEAWIYVAPGHYSESAEVVSTTTGMLWSGYNIHIIGCGCPVPGKDYGVSINYDGSADTTAAFLLSGSGNHLANLHIYCSEAIPALYLAGGDNNLIENCVIECDGTNCTYGILADSMKGSWIRNCVIHNAATAGIKVAGGTDHYAIHGGIEGCQIHSDVTGAKGIYLDSQATLVAYNFRIAHNFVDVLGGGATSKGIDNDNTGGVMISENLVFAHTTPIETANSSLTVANHTNASATIVDPDPAKS